MLFLPAGKSEGLVLVLLSLLLLCFLRWDNKHTATVDHTLEQTNYNQKKKQYHLDVKNHFSQKYYLCLQTEERSRARA